MITDNNFVIYKDIVAFLIMMVTIVILVYINIKFSRQMIKFKGKNLRKNK